MMFNNFGDTGIKGVHAFDLYIGVDATWLKETSQAESEPDPTTNKQSSQYTAQNNQNLFDIHKWFAFLF